MKAPNRSCRIWIERLRVDYIVRGGSLETWSGDYLKILKRLPQEEPLTEKLLRDLVDGTPPNTKTRKRACLAVGALARFAAIDFDARPFAGDYGLKSQAPRTIPLDEEILAWGLTIRNRDWRWIYGLIATYGLRPHEAFFVDLASLRDKNHALKVVEGKTGPRTVYPYPTDWIRRFLLFIPAVPNVNLERSHEQIGHSATRYFWELKCPFKLYDLRHAYALRLMRSGVRDSFAARFLGHSEEVHRKIYRRWIDERDLGLEWERTNQIIVPAKPRPKNAKRRSYSASYLYPQGNSNPRP